MAEDATLSRTYSRMNSRSTCAAARSWTWHAATNSFRKSRSNLMRNPTSFLVMLRVYPMDTHLPREVVPARAVIRGTIFKRDPVLAPGRRSYWRAQHLPRATPGASLYAGSLPRTCSARRPHSRSASQAARPAAGRRQVRVVKQGLPATPSWCRLQLR